jgi:hypothetical protein
MVLFSVAFVAGGWDSGHRAASGMPRSSTRAVATSAPRFNIETPTTLRIPAMDMLWAFGSIWLSQPNRVSRLDPRTGRVEVTIPVPGTSDFRQLAAGAGSIWVDDTGTQTVTRIDPVRNTVVASVPLGRSVFVTDGLAFVDGKLWVVRPAPTDDTRGDVVSIDPASNRIRQRALIPRTFDVMSGGSHALWYVRASNLLRFDTRTHHVTVARRNVDAVLAVTKERLWLLTTAGIIETDQGTGAQIGPAIGVRDTVNLAAAIGRDAVWIAGQPDSSTGGNVTPYDPITHRPLGPETPVGLPIVTMTARPNALWIDAGGVTRIPFTG